MLRVFRGEQHEEFSDEFEGMLRLRYRVFKEQLSWKVWSAGGIEFDHFDRPNTVYVVSMRDDGVVDGTFRLLPTDQPYMLSEVFPFLLEGGQAPCAPGIWEMSRLAVAPEYGARGSMRKAGCTVQALFAAALEYAEGNGIDEIVVVHDAPMARLTRRLLAAQPSWETGTVTIGNTLTSAAQYPCVPSMAFRARYGMAQPVLDTPALKVAV